MFSIEEQFNRSQSIAVINKLTSEALSYLSEIREYYNNAYHTFNTEGGLRIPPATVTILLSHFNSFNMTLIIIQSRQMDFIKEEELNKTKKSWLALVCEACFGAATTAKDEPYLTDNLNKFQPTINDLNALISALKGYCLAIQQIKDYDQNEIITSFDRIYPELKELI